MGYALAEECAGRGAKVTLVSGPVQMTAKHPAIRTLHVESAEEMASASKEVFPAMDAAILCAAVADFTPEQQADRKIKRLNDDLVLRLKPTEDIAAVLGKTKAAKQVPVGFALETDQELQHAQDKLKRKNFDFIVLNSLNNQGAGFRYDTNQVTIVDASGKTDFPLKPKSEVAVDIVNRLRDTLQSKK